MKDAQTHSCGSTPLPVVATPLLRLIARTVAAALIEDEAARDVGNEPVAGVTTTSSAPRRLSHEPERHC